MCNNYLKNKQTNENIMRQLWKSIGEKVLVAALGEFHTAFFRKVSPNESERKQLNLFKKGLSTKPSAEGHRRDCSRFIWSTQAIYLTNNLENYPLKIDRLFMLVFTKCQIETD